jgi:hypothetical protein
LDQTDSGGAALMEKSGGQIDDGEKWIDNGGRAFPHVSGLNSGLHSYPGMTLRDWFAGQALASFAQGDGAKTRAAFAYEIADAMIAARKR